MHIHGGNIYKNKEVVDFSANINPLGMPERVADAAVKGIKLCVNYPDTEGWELKAKIGCCESVDIDNIILGNGAADLIFTLGYALRPKKALVIEPTFAEYEQAMRCCRCDVYTYPLKKENTFELQEDFFSYLDEQLDIVFLCNPNNPTGHLTDRAFLEKVIEICRTKNIRVVIDECFLGFRADQETYTTKHLLSANPHLFILKAFTKLYAMPGLRLGYGLCSDRALLSKMCRHSQPWNVSIPAQQAGIAALAEEDYVLKSIHIIEKEKQYLYRQLTGMGLKVYPPSVNYMLFEGPDNLAAETLKYQIQIRDCSNFKGLGKGFYRVAVRLREQNNQLLKVLGMILRQQISLE